MYFLKFKGTRLEKTYYFEATLNRILIIVSPKSI